MRRRDFITLLVVIAFSSLLSWLIGGALLSYKSDSNTINTLPPISSSLQLPDASDDEDEDKNLFLDDRFFNRKSINPTIRTIIGESEDD